MFLKHPAWVWFKKHDKSKLPAVDAALQARFDAGSDFEQYAEQFYPDGIKIGFSSYQQYLDMPRKTGQALKEGAKTIFQGRFETKDITCIVDILHKTGEKKFDLIEIKSSTKVKGEHLTELAFQTIVLEDAGMTIDKMFVIHTNKDYIRSGDIISNKFCIKSEDLSASVREIIEKTRYQISKALEVIAQPATPDISARHSDRASFREWIGVYRKIKGLDARYTIYELAALNPELLGELEDKNVLFLKDIPAEIVLNKKQSLQVESARTGKQIINKNEVKRFLNELVYPIHFFDYETLSGVVPAFDGVQPHQQVPFQYSLHILGKQKGELIHKEFLPVKYGNPVLALIQQMKKDFLPTGSILTWNKKFEMDRNKEMARMFPEHADFLHSLNKRIVDLMVPFFDSMFVDQDFHGSASLKAVLPVLVPDLSYESLNISSGAMVGDTWTKLTTGTFDEKESEAIRKDLLAYCEQDTLGMVRILEVLENLPEKARTKSSKTGIQETLF